MSTTAPTTATRLRGGVDSANLIQVSNDCVWQLHVLQQPPGKTNSKVSYEKNKTK